MSYKIVTPQDLSIPKTTGNFKINSINCVSGRDLNTDNTYSLLATDYKLSNPPQKTHTIMSNREKDVIIVINGDLEKLKRYIENAPVNPINITIINVKGEILGLYQKNRKDNTSGNVTDTCVQVSVFTDIKELVISHNNCDVFILNPDFKVYNSIVNQSVLKECLTDEIPKFVKRFGKCIYWSHKNNVSDMINKVNHNNFTKVHIEKTKSDSMKSLEYN